MRRGGDTFLKGTQRLFRLPLALMNGVAAVGGYLLFPSNKDGLVAGTVCLGVALLAAAGSAINQVLEADLDALMRRTADRPLPSRKLSATAAGCAGGAALLAGSSILAACGGALPAALGVATLLWYLAVYTPLKRVTCCALLVGALCGCASPVIGWTVAGGSPGDFSIVLVAGILYLWQVPHFWMLQRRHADDYKRAGFPIFSPGAAGMGLAPFQILWMAAMIAGALMLPAFGIVTRNQSLWALAFGFPLLLSPFRRFEPAVFAGITLFPAVVTLALYAGR